MEEEAGRKLLLFTGWNAVSPFSAAVKHFVYSVAQSIIRGQVRHKWPGLRRRNFVSLLASES